MVALLYMFRSALNIYSSKEYIYIMDDALSFIFLFFFFGYDGCFFIIQLICLHVPWIYMFRGALNIFFEGIYLCYGFMDVLSMLWMIYIYLRYVFFEVNSNCAKC